MKIFAHRGASGLAPENTMAAIELALSMPIDGIEIDIYPVEDEYIVIHDRWLTRTTGLSKRVDQINLNQLRSISAGLYQNQQQSIPFLSEVLALSWGSKCLNIELKHLSDSRHFLNYLDTCITKNANLLSDNILLSSFNHHHLHALRQQNSHYRLGWLTASNYLTYAQQAKDQGCCSINIDIDVVDRVMVENAHSMGLKVFVFTVDELEDIKMLQSIDVDGVYTNWPDRIHAFLNSDCTNR